MARLQEEIVAIKLSKVVRDTDTVNTQLISEEIGNELEMIVQQLLNDATVVVEVVRA